MACDILVLSPLYPMECDVCFHEVFGLKFCTRLVGIKLPLVGVFQAQAQWISEDNSSWPVCTDGLVCKYFV